MVLDSRVVDVDDEEDGAGEAVELYVVEVPVWLTTSKLSPPSATLLSPYCVSLNEQGAGYFLMVKPASAMSVNLYVPLAASGLPGACHTP